MSTQSNQTPQIAIGDFLTRPQIDAAIKLYKHAAPGTFAKRCADEILRPDWTNINSRINAAAGAPPGTPNEPAYFAYAIEYGLMMTGVER